AVRRVPGLDAHRAGAGARHRRSRARHRRAWEPRGRCHRQPAGWSADGPFGAGRAHPDREGEPDEVRRDRHRRRRPRPPRQDLAAARARLVSGGGGTHLTPTAPRPRTTCPPLASGPMVDAPGFLRGPFRSRRVVVGSIVAIAILLVVVAAAAAFALLNRGGGG